MAKETSALADICGERLVCGEGGIAENRLRFSIMAGGRQSRSTGWDCAWGGNRQAFVNMLQ